MIILSRTPLLLYVLPATMHGEEEMAEQQHFQITMRNGQNKGTNFLKLLTFYVDV